MGTSGQACVVLLKDCQIYWNVDSIIDSLMI